MSFENTRTQVVCALEENFGMSIRPEFFDTALVEVPSINYDSLRVMEIISLLEELFDLEVDLVVDDVQFSFRSINNISKLVENKTRSNSRIA